MAANEGDADWTETQPGDWSLNVFDTATGNLLHRIETDWAFVHYPRISPDGNIILVMGTTLPVNEAFAAGEGNTLFLVDVGTGEVLRELTDPDITGFLRNQIWSPDGSQIMACDVNGMVFVWDAATGDLVRKFTAHDPGVMIALAWSNDGSKYATGGGIGSDALVKIWDAETGELILTLVGHEPPSAITSLAWSSDDTRLLSTSGTLETGSTDYSARIWDTTTGQQLVIIDNHSDSVVYGDWSPDDSRIVTISHDDTTRVWDANTGAELLRLMTPNSGWAVGWWTRDGNRIVLTGVAQSGIWHAWQSTDELIAHAYDCCVTRELTPEERAQFGLSPLD